MLDRVEKLSELDDARLIQKAKDGDVNAFGELYERYADAIFRFIYSQTAYRLDAEDLTADVFLKAWQNLHKYEERGFPFSAYLFRIARNTLVDSQRKRKPITISNEEISNLSETEPTDPGTLAFLRAQHGELVTVMAQMKEDYRTVLVLRFLNDLSPAEIAQVMGRSVGSVRVLQHRALKILRAMLHEKKIDER